MPSAIKVANVYAAAYSQGNSARNDRGSTKGEPRSGAAKGFKDFLKEEMSKRASTATS